MKVHDFYESGFFLVLSFLITIAAFVFDWGYAPAQGYILFCGGVFLIFACCYGKYYILTENEIQHMFLGICIQRTKWVQIRDVMRVYNQSGERSSLKVLMVTTNKASQIYRPNKRGYVESKRFYREWLTGKVFMLRSPSPKIADQIVTYVEAHYGTLDYDFFQKTT